MIRRMILIKCYIIVKCSVTVTLDFETPNGVFARLVAEAQADGEKCCAST